MLAWHDASRIGKRILVIVTHSRVIPGRTHHDFEGVTVEPAEYRGAGRSGCELLRLLCFTLSIQFATVAAFHPTPVFGRAGEGVQKLIRK